MATAHDCGMTFVKEYYTHLASNPAASALTNMYTKFSQMVTEDGELVTGVEEISSILTKKALEQRKFRLYGVGCYPSAYESILVLVRGVVLTREASKNFNQTFILVPVKGYQGAPENTFYIYNDVLELTDDVEVAPIPAAPVQEAAPEYVEPEPVYEPEPVEEAVEEAAEEPVAAPEPEEEKPAPVAAPTPAAAPKEEPKVVEPPRNGWAGIIRKKEGGGPTSGAPQVVSGGAIPNRVPAAAKPKTEERGARGTSPTRAGRGPRGTSPQKFQKPQTFSIYVRLSGLKKDDINEADIDKLFSKYGKVASKTLQVEKNYCFVDFVEKKSMDAAIAAAEAGEIVHGGKALECNSRSGEKKPASKPGAKRADDKPRGLATAPANPTTSTNGAAPARRK